MDYADIMDYLDISEYEGGAQTLLAAPYDEDEDIETFLRRFQNTSLEEALETTDAPVVEDIVDEPDDEYEIIEPEEQHAEGADELKVYTLIDNYRKQQEQFKGNTNKS